MTRFVGLAAALAVALGAVLATPATSDAGWRHSRCCYVEPCCYTYPVVTCPTYSCCYTPVAPCCTPYASGVVTPGCTSWYYPAVSHYWAPTIVRVCGACGP